MNPYATLEKYLLYLALIASVFCAGLYRGWHMDEVRHKAITDKQQAEAFEQYKADAQKINDLSVKLAQSEAKTKTVYQTITNTVEKTIHEKPILTTTRCFDDDVLRDFNADLQRPSADTGKSSLGLRATTSP